MEFLAEKKSICEIGERLYQKGFAAANEGNLSLRVDDDKVLCTPTLICKGFMTPADICTVDMEGNQIAGTRKRTSEILLHLEVYRRRTDVKSVVHCHPPHATAFGVAREAIPVCVLPEPEIFLGEVPIAPYETPGGQDFAETILPFIPKTNTIVLANHGTISYESTIERAYWLTEILDAYCRILMLAKQLGGIQYLSNQHGAELLDMRRDWGFDDVRTHDDAGKPAQFAESWNQSDVSNRSFPAHPNATEPGAKRELPADLEWLVESISDRVAEKLQSTDG